MKPGFTLPQPLIDDAVSMALREDLGRAGDITTLSTIPEGATARAVIASRQDGCLAGLDFVTAAFRQIGGDVTVEFEKSDGDRVGPGDVVAHLSGSARELLSAERVGLNYLGHLSGIATATARFADRIAHTKAKVCCTRKTTPGLRAFEKYAVRCGGGMNHRFGLDDAVLIKDNHIAVAGGVAEAVRSARAFVGHLVKVEIEVDTLDQLKDAMTASPDAVLLDNMGPDLLKEAVAIIDGRAVAEASGGVTLETVQAIAESGVDMISTGWITHSAPVLDLGLDISIQS
ncbi:carboxylating nicotinate-nucleotide diphosphorylase [Coralliovum pocilloporae]|uniref:carboxylating nicotinate-nucleotide diphosphorylase n=1 Tax=Coralliovum pocilloporae TaxID=3066369 RepID=UPI0033076684